MTQKDIYDLKKDEIHQSKWQKNKIRKATYEIILNISNNICNIEI